MAESMRQLLSAEEIKVSGSLISFKNFLTLLISSPNLLSSCLGAFHSRTDRCCVNFSFKDLRAVKEAYKKGNQTFSLQKRNLSNEKK